MSAHDKNLSCTWWPSKACKHYSLNLHSINSFMDSVTTIKSMTYRHTSKDGPGSNSRAVAVS